MRETTKTIYRLIEKHVIRLRELISNTSQTLTNALNTHKSSGDHDGRYYQQSEVDTKDQQTLTDAKSHSDLTLGDHAGGGDHDFRYYRKPEIDTKLSDLESTIDQGIAEDLEAHKSSGDHDNRYYRQGEVDTKLNLKVNIADVVDVLTSSSTSQPLSANQGRLLKGLIDDINTLLSSDDNTLDELQEIVEYIKLNRESLENLTIGAIAGLRAELDSKLDSSVHASHIESGDHDERYYTKGQVLNRENTMRDFLQEWTRELTDVKVNPVFVEGSSEAEYFRGATESWSDVFNTWQRISRRGSLTETEARPGELDAWVLDQDPERIRCTINSSSTVGFIAPDAFDDFTLEAVLSSSNGDDDWIGFCVAWAELPNGEVYTLDVMRAHNGPAPMTIVKNHGTSQGETIANVYNGLKWATGEEATGPKTGGGSQGWSLLTTGVKLKVTRTGDQLTFETSQPDESAYFDPAKTTVDLSASEQLEVFRGRQRYGYICRSQSDSTWNVLSRPVELDTIVDLANRSVWELSGGTWSESPIGDQIPNVEPGKFYTNPETGKHYFSLAANDVRRIYLSDVNDIADAAMDNRVSLGNNAEIVYDDSTVSVSFQFNNGA